MYEIQTELRISNTSAKFAKSIQVAPACPWSIKTDWEQNCLFQQEKSQVFVFIWMSTKLRGGDYHYCTGGGRVKTARESTVCMCKRDIKRALPGDLKVPMFPHFWEFVIYSCWSHIKQDQRLLPDIFWTYWGNSNDYQRILPTNDDIETILRESEYKKKKKNEHRADCAQRDTIKWFSRLFIVPLFTSEQLLGSVRWDISVSYRYGLYWVGDSAVPWCPVKVLLLLISSLQAHTLQYLWAKGW